MSPVKIFCTKTSLCTFTLYVFIYRAIVMISKWGCNLLPFIFIWFFWHCHSNIHVSGLVLWYIFMPLGYFSITEYINPCKINWCKITFWIVSSRSLVWTCAGHIEFLCCDEMFVLCAGTMVFVAGGLIPARFLTLISHLTITIVILWSRVSSSLSLLTVVFVRSSVHKWITNSVGLSAVGVC